jgi:mono/diheme cytochrome c family protein
MITPTSRALCLVGAATLLSVAVFLLSKPLDAQGLAIPSYTDAQAVQGKAAFDRSCASCHGANLDDGEFGPPLKGVEFRLRWGAKPLDTLLTT